MGNTAGHSQRPTAKDHTPTSKSEMGEVYDFFGSCNAHKVDSDGKFVAFAGVTVVADVTPESMPRWQELHAAMQADHEIHDHFGLLPPASYHMTTVGGACNARSLGGLTGEAWKSYLTSELPRYAALHATLKKDEHACSGRIVGLYVGQVIYLEIEVGDEEREWIISTAKRHDMAGKLIFPLHVTLGYLFRDMTAKTASSIDAKLRGLIERVFGAGGTVEFSASSLRYYRDMTEFIPWDATALIDPLELS